MDYFGEIESHFASKRGTTFVLNAKDWALMKEWHEAGVPLPVVIEAIDTVFEKAAERKKVVNSIHYCKHAVKELWDERWGRAPRRPKLLRPRRWRRSPRSCLSRLTRESGSSPPRRASHASKRS